MQHTHLEDRLRSLPTLNKAALLKLWSETFSNPPAQTLRRELLVSLLAYRIQEAALGGLSHSARRRLKTLAEKHRETKS